MSLEVRGLIDMNAAGDMDMEATEAAGISGTFSKCAGAVQATDHPRVHGWVSLEIDIKPRPERKKEIF